MGRAEGALLLLCLANCHWNYFAAFAKKIQTWIDKFWFFPIHVHYLDIIFNKKTRMKHKKSWMRIRTWIFKNHLLQSRITKPFHIFLYFLIFIFCSMSDRPTDSVNYILDAHWYRKSAVYLTAEKSTLTQLP